MNIEEFDYTMAFDAFAQNYFCNDFDIRNSLLISSLNKSYQMDFLKSSIWSEYRKIYSVEQKDISNEDLKKRMITDFTNVFSESAPLEYFQSQPKKMGLKEILVVHGFARIFYEPRLWETTRSQLLDFGKNEGGFLRNENNAEIPGFFEQKKNVFKNLELNNLPDFEEINKLSIDSTLKIDNWININKINFHLITDLSCYTPLRFPALTPEISLFTGLKKIHINLGLKNLPDGMINLKNLNYIDLQNNLLEEFPVVLTDLIKLSAINLSHNKIKAIPEEIGNLTKLKRLTLANNAIVSIGKTLCGMKLDSLNLEKNPINRTVLPIDMAAKKIFIAETAVQQEKEQLTIRKASEKMVSQHLKMQKDQFAYQYTNQKHEQAQIEQSIKNNQQQQYLQQIVFHHQIFKPSELEVKKSQMKQFQADQIKKLMELYGIKKSFDQGEHYRKVMNSTEPLTQKIFKQIMKESKKQQLELITLLQQVQQLQFKHRIELGNLKNQLFQQIQSTINIIEQKHQESDNEDSSSVAEDVKEHIDAIQNNKRKNDEDDEDEFDVKKPRHK